MGVHDRLELEIDRGSIDALTVPIEIGRDADLFVSEAYVYDKPLPLHLSYRQLVEKLPLIRPKRLILTHMSEDMLGRGGDAIAHETAEDGMIVKI